MKKIENALITRRYFITGAKRTSNYWWAFLVSFGGLAFFMTGFASFLQKNILFFNRSKTISFLPQGLIMCFYGCLGLLFGLYLWCTIFWKVGDGFNEFNKKEGFVRIFRWGLPGKNRRIDLKYKIDGIEGVRVELKEGVNPRRTLSLKMSAKTKLLSKRKNQHVAKPQSPFALLTKPAFLQRALFATKLWQPFLQEDVKSTSQESKLPTYPREDERQKDAFTIPLTRVGQPISLEKIESQASELAQFLRVSLETSYLDF